MAIELGAAYVSILPSTSKLAPALTKSMNKITPQVGNQAGRSMGSRMASAAGRALKAGAVVGVAAVGATMGAALIGGFKSAVDQQKFQATVSGLYGDAGKAFKTLDQIKQLSKSSPIEYSAYGKAAQSLAYAGVEGKDAVEVLDNVGWAIVGAGGGADDLNRAMDGILKGVNNGGVVMNDTLGMISDSGFPIIDALSEKFGTSGDEIKKMAADGKISIDDVLSVMQNGTGELAKKQKKAGKEVAKTFGESFKIAKDNIQVAIGETMIPLLEKLAPMMKPIGDAIVKGIEKLPQILGAVVGWFKEWWPILAAVVGGLTAYRLILLGITIGTAAYNAVLAVQRFATAGAAVQMRILNAAMKANPIGLIITAITLLVAGFILMYKKVGWFRNGVNAAWAGIKIAVAAVGNWFRDVLWPIMQAVWNGIVVGAKWLWGVMKLVWSGIMIAVKAVVTWFTGTMVPWFTGAWNVILGAVKFVWNWVKANWPLILGFITGPIGLAVALIIMHWGSIKRVLLVGWNFIKAYVFTPIKNFVVKTIPNAFKFLVSAVKIYINMWKMVLNVVWAWVKTYVFTPIRNFVMKTIPNAFKYFVAYIRIRIAVWRAILSAAWNFVKKWVFTPLRNFVTKTIPNAFRYFVAYVKNRLTVFRNFALSIWNWVKQHVFNPMRNFITKTVPNAFKKGVNSIKTFWNKLKKVASKPMKFVIDTVYNNGLREIWNPIAGFIGKDKWKLDYVSTKNFATGGRVSGPGTATSDSIPARLSNNEHVLTAKDVKNLGGHGNVYALRNAAAQPEPHYKPPYQS